MGAVLMPYYNTNEENGDILKQSRAKADSQADTILEFFVQHKEQLLTPEDVWRSVYTSNTPLTSVRRAMTDLTALGCLEKMPKMQIGQYGKQIHTWRFVNDIQRVPTEADGKAS